MNEWHWAVKLYANNGSTHTETFSTYTAALEWMVTLMRAGRQPNYHSWELRNTTDWTW